MGFFDDIAEGLRAKLSSDIEELQKSEADFLPDNPEHNLEQEADHIGRKTIIDDPFYEYNQNSFIYRSKMSRISNKTLKDVSLRDWVVSSIMQARIDTMLRFSRKQEKKFDTGFKVIKRENHDELTEDDKKNIAMLEDFVYNCGRTKDTPPSDRMDFGEFLKLSTRDALTFGNIAVEKVLTRKGGLHRFRPLPAESVYLINKRASRDVVEKEMRAAQDRNRNMFNNPGDNNPEKKHTHNEKPLEYYRYMQRSHDNMTLAVFGDEDMIFKNFNPQNFADSLGYCYSPLELSIVNVTNHLSVENYNANFFTHGYAARGILHLKGTVTRANLKAFQRQFYNTISGANHAWRTPIVAGLDEIEWVPLAGNAKEMEYLNYNNHLIRAICSQFQIDPVEVGLDQLVGGGGTGTGSSQQANNEYKINYSRERGLYPILMYFEDFINCDIFPAIDKKLAEKYVFKFVGYTDETPQTQVSLLQAEMTVHSSMNDLLRATDKPKIDHPIADLPLNESFWGLVEKNLTKGEIREIFLGDKDATKRAELQYISADPAFMSWQQMLLTLKQQAKQEEMMQAQAEQQQQQVEHQQEMERSEHDREQEKHELEQAEAHSRHAHNIVSGGQKSWQEAGKEFGVGSKPAIIDGTPTQNPINNEAINPLDEEDEQQ
jgi:hypothetical protein